MLRTRFRPLRPFPVSGLPAGAGAWSVVLRIAGALATLAMGVLLGRWLGPAGLGQFGLVIAATMLLAQIAQLGLPMLATREISIGHMKGDWPGVATMLVSFGTVTLACGLAIGLIFAGGGWLLFGDEASAGTALLLGALLVPLVALVNLTGAELRGLDRLVKGQALEVAIRPALMTLLLLIAYAWSGAMSPALALAANVAAFGATLGLGVLWLRSALPEWTPARAAGRDLRGWLRSAAPLALSDLLRQVDGVYGILLVGAIASVAETGIFRVAVSSVVIIAMPNTILHLLMAPTLARLAASGDSARLGAVLTHSARLAFAALCAGLAVVALAGEWLIGGLFGDAFTPAWLPLLILVAANAVHAFFGVGQVLLAMSAEETAFARCFAATAIVSIASAIPLTFVWGASGAAAAAVLGYLAGNLLVWRYVRRSTGLDCSALGLPALDVARPAPEGGPPVPTP